jgi:hypothetical protein
LKIPQDFIDKWGHGCPVDLIRDTWKAMGRNDEERRKNWTAQKKLEAEKRKRRAQLRQLNRKPVTKIARTEAPQRTTHDFPYLKHSDIPQDGGRKATIIRSPQITETKWGKRYRIALQFESGERRRWSMNNITFKNLLNVFGRNTSEWLGKEVYFKTEQFKIQGKDVMGIIGDPAK